MSKNNFQKTCIYYKIKVNNVNGGLKLKIGYARVSTNEQTLDMQIDALQKAGCNRIYKEKVSGVRDERIELQKALDTLRDGDQFIVYKFDRLARSTKRLIEIAEYLEQNNIELVSICDKVDTTTPAGKAMFRMFAVFAEFERDIIRERVLSGLQAARARGKKGGRPRISEKTKKKALTMYQSKKYSLKEIKEETGVSVATIYNWIAEEKEKKEGSNE